MANVQKVRESRVLSTARRAVSRNHQNSPKSLICVHLNQVLKLLSPEGVQCSVRPGSPVGDQGNRGSLSRWLAGWLDNDLKCIFSCLHLKIKFIFCFSWTANSSILINYISKRTFNTVAQ